MRNRAIRRSAGKAVMEVPCETCPAALTAPQAILKAEEAFRAGRLADAECYINIAYAIFDANFAQALATAEPAHKPSR